MFSGLAGVSVTCGQISFTETTITDLRFSTHHALRVAPLVRVAIRRSVGIMIPSVANFSQVAHQVWIFGVIAIGLF